MNLHDPARKRIGGRPLFEGGTVIPNATISLSADGSVWVAWMLPTGNNEAKWFSVPISPDNGDFSLLMHSFANDPEGTLESLFARERIPPRLRQRTIRSIVTLEDIGL